VNWLGDAVMTTPALLRLREEFPAARISLLTPEKLVDLWKNHPAVDEMIGFKADEDIEQIVSKLKYGPGQLLEFEQRILGEFVNELWNLPRRFWEVGDDLQRPNLEAAAKATRSSLIHPFRNPLFDVALVLPNSPRSALEVFLARIPQRIGYARPWRNFFLTQTVAPRAAAVKMRKRSVAEIKQLAAADVSGRQTSVSRALTHTAPNSHQIHEYLHLVAALGANPEPLPPQLFVTLEEIGAARRKFGLAEISQPIFGMNPGAEYGPAKRWPVERFIAAAREIQERTDCVWLLLGGKQDVALTGQIAAALRAAHPTPYDLAGQTTLRELMALLKLCRVLLSNDTGPMHVAAALGTPVVVPFGSTSPELTGPGLPGDPRHHLLKSNAPCAPCFLRECPIDFRCLQGTGVDPVVAAVGEVLQREA
jgi:heptosyltransferase-2